MWEGKMYVPTTHTLKPINLSEESTLVSKHLGIEIQGQYQLMITREQYILREVWLKPYLADKSVHAQKHKSSHVSVSQT